MKKILFVCLGNICRSPLAEALFRKHIEEQKLSHKFSCDSCGTAGYHIGKQPDSRSVANAKQNGLLYTHIGRQLTKKDIQEFDYILAMDKYNYEDIQEMNKIEHQHIYKIRDFDLSNKGADVPDPYYGGAQGFQEVYTILDRATLHLLEELLK